MTTESTACDLFLTGGIYLIVVLLLVALLLARAWRRRRAHLAPAQHATRVPFFTRPEPTRNPTPRRRT